MINPLHPNISMHILHTVLYTFLKVLTRRICLTIKASQVGDHFLYSHGLNVCFRGDSDRRKQFTNHSQGLLEAFGAISPISVANLRINIILMMDEKRTHTVLNKPSTPQTDWNLIFHYTFTAESNITVMGIKKTVTN